MRDIIWSFFEMTGNIDAYLLYKSEEDWLEDVQELAGEKPLSEED
jgi:hypothetical protein